MPETAIAESPVKAVAEHLVVLEKLLARNVDAAAEALEQHLKVSRDRAIARIDIIASGAQPETSPFLVRLR